jgi:hypothetical protein
MPNVSNLSPLAFEVLKYICNTGGPTEQIIDKDTLGIGTQEDFLGALAELQQAGLVNLSRDAVYIHHTSPEELATDSIMNTEAADNMAPIKVQLAVDKDDVCKTLELYLQAANK